jgi:hypothetical protein
MRLLWFENQVGRRFTSLSTMRRMLKNSPRPCRLNPLGAVPAGPRAFEIDGELEASLPPMQPKRPPSFEARLQGRARRGPRPLSGATTGVTGRMPPRKAASRPLCGRDPRCCRDLPVAHQCRLDGQRARPGAISRSAVGRHEGRPGHKASKQASQRRSGADTKVTPEDLSQQAAIQWPRNNDPR